MQLEHVRYCGLHARLFSAARHSVLLLHPMTETAHHMACRVTCGYTSSPAGGAGR